MMLRRQKLKEISRVEPFEIRMAVRRGVSRATDDDLCHAHVINSNTENSVCK